MADQAHQAGNVAYRKGDLANAAKAYSLAFKLDPNEPKYSSNLSAVYYEQGRYTLCIGSIIDSWRALRAKHTSNNHPDTPPLTDALAVKLSLRYVKAKLNRDSVASNLTNKANKEKTAEIERDILKFCSAIARQNDEASQKTEFQKVWETWVKAESDQQTPDERAKHRAEAEKRLRDLPIFRSSL
ncbi:hypothetical protein CVT24_005109 [Panaeolus cyanescens]|uniref:Uncharacterized protein n=1 Tax=Panaeolus cyanescens TaxID=181874 RepID=A0A409VPW5_9AGAR|nr:hypothetical protein CVT24_005109 [Panaeolus cyanescens]